MFFPLRFGGGGASAHLEQTCFRMDGVAFVACVPFCAQRKRRELQDKLPTKARHDGEAKNKRESSEGKRRTCTQTKHFWLDFSPKTSPKGALSANLAPRASGEAREDTFSIKWARFMIVLASTSEPKQAHNLQRFSERF